MLNIDLEPLKELYQEILKTQALGERELKALKYLIDKLQETKEELESSSFALLEKNTELFNESNNILQKINDLSNILDNLEKRLNEEKVSFDKEIKQKFDNLIHNVKKQITSIITLLDEGNKQISNQFKELNELISVEFSHIKSKYSDEAEEVEKIRKEYQRRLKQELENFKRKIELQEEEIKKQGWLNRFFSAMLAFLLGYGLAFFLQYKHIQDLKYEIKQLKQTIYYYQNQDSSYNNE